MKPLKICLYVHFQKQNMQAQCQHYEMMIRYIINYKLFA